MTARDGWCGFPRQLNVANANASCYGSSCVGSKR